MEDDDLVQCMIQQSDEIDVLSSMYSPEELLMGKRDENGLLYTHTIVYKTVSSFSKCFKYIQNN